MQSFRTLQKKGTKHMNVSHLSRTKSDLFVYLSIYLFFFKVATEMLEKIEDPTYKQNFNMRLSALEFLFTGR